MNEGEVRPSFNGRSGEMSSPDTIAERHPGRCAAQLPRSRVAAEPVRSDNLDSMLALLTAIVIAMIVFGGFYLFAQWKSSTGVTTTPHSQPVAP